MLVYIKIRISVGRIPRWVRFAGYPFVTSVVGITELMCGRRSDLGVSNVDLGDFIVDLVGFYVDFLELMLVIWAILPRRNIGFKFRSEAGHQ